MLIQDVHHQNIYQMTREKNKKGINHNNKPVWNFPFSYPPNKIG